MISASKAVILFAALAVVGTVLVIGPRELKDIVSGARKAELAAVAKPEVMPGVKAEPKLAAKTEAKTEPKVEAGTEAKIEPKTELKTEPKTGTKPETKSVDAASAPSAVAPKSGPLAATEKQAATLPDLAPAKPAAPADSGPSFDVARVDDDGVAVIAGRAAPGARVELLRDGTPLDTAVADSSGQFVMTPPKLPGGKYELSLRAKSPDGSVAQSQRTVPVALAEALPPPPRLASADKDALAARPAAAPKAQSKIEARIEPKSESRPDSKPDSKSSTALAAVTPAEPPTGTLAAPGASRVVSRGDSLWALSRRAYGDGARYDLIFSANRDKIRNPDLIYPGQTFVLPKR